MLPALRMVVDCTLNALPAIKWILVLGMFLAIILGLFGMQFFGGKLWSCQFPPGVVESYRQMRAELDAPPPTAAGDRTLSGVRTPRRVAEYGEPFASATSPVTLTECAMPTIVTKQECEFYNGTWANTEYNFDNIGQALVVVFITSTADNWQDTMYTGIDSVDVGKNLVYDYNLWNSLFYVIVTMLALLLLGEHVREHAGGPVHQGVRGGGRARHERRPAERRCNRRCSCPACTAERTVAGHAHVRR